MFEPDGTTAFELDAGMEIQGGISRIFPKKSLRIEAKASYGASSIDHQVFPDKPTSSYQHLVLRSSSAAQRSSWAWVSGSRRSRNALRSARTPPPQ